MRAPEFWKSGFGPGPALLTPLSIGFRAGGWVRRALVRPWRAPVPVICVGGLVAGGSGKTPTAIALGAWLQRAGMKVHFLGRGYGGRLGRRPGRPVLVDRLQHRAAEVGDEALLLAAQAHTWVARNRRAAARAAVEAGAEVLVMDDGHQNPSLAKDFSFVVVDGTYGFGNRRVIPAGPLRETLDRGLARADAVVLVGENVAGVTATIPTAMPVLRVTPEPGPEAAALMDEPVVAFAGLGHPEKFFATLEQIGCDVRARHAFPDHHPYTFDEVSEILKKAEDAGATAVTTAKDAVRLPEGMSEKVRVVTMTYRWRDEEALARLIGPVLEHG
jgi:tetraacyldisaccharide 4'-kinase